MNDAPLTPTFGQALAWAFQRLTEEMRTVLILSALLIVILLVSFAPFIGFYVQLFGSLIDGNLDPVAMGSMDFPGLGLLFTFIVMIIGSSAVYVLFSRLTDMNRNALLEGGFGVLISRALWVVWRLICAIGWLILMSLIMYAALFVILLVVGVSATFAMGEGAAGLIIVLTLALYIVMLVVFVAIYSALSISIYAASRDNEIGILASWKALRGVRRRMIFANIILYVIMVVTYLLALFLAVLMFPPMGTAAVIIYIVLSSLLAGIYAFLWLSIGAAFSNHALGRT